ncbi:hypothetical protein [Paraliobacillus sediminis]|uniref:hypothetical protein n=1 Tax=Paraliobacillus sediminis TaxID=1885916 RepID=UPI000E3E0FEB|nr:hypothetical protein [Paraliobacillus sediminis]
MGFFDLFKKKQKIDIMDKPADLEFKRSANNLSEAQYIDDPVEKEAFLRDCEKRYLVEGNTVDLHFTYNELINVYYRQRDNWNHALDNCIECCEKDIELFPVFATKWKEEYGDSSPRIPSFERKAIIHEKQGEINKAIYITELAIKYNLIDKTKGGFEGRLERLIKKSGIKNRESFPTKDKDAAIKQPEEKHLPIDVDSDWRDDFLKK